MALDSLPPWVSVSPSDFVRAAEAGASTGISAERQRASSEEAGNRLRLAYDTLASQERRQDEMAQAKMELAQSQMDQRERATTAALALREAQMQGLQDYREGMLGAKEKELGIRSELGGANLDLRRQLAETSSGLQQQRLESAAQALQALQTHRQETERLNREIEERRATGAERKEGPTYTFTNPDGSKIVGKATDPAIAAMLKKRAEEASKPGLLSRLLGHPNAPLQAVPGQTPAVPSASAALAPPAAADNDFVVVTNPSGKRVKIRKAQLDEALAEGYTQ